MTAIEMPRTTTELLAQPKVSIWRFVAPVILLLVLVALPVFVQSRYVLGQISLALIWGMVAVQWNLLFGFAGVFSLAPMSLFALGGYGLATTSLYLGLPVPLALLAGAAIATLVSLVIALACLRMTGIYVALLTYAIAQVIYLLIISDASCFRQANGVCQAFTGGPTGFARFGDFGTRAWLRGNWAIGNYAFIAIGFLFSLLVASVVLRSPMGLSFRALRDNPEYAVARGVNRFHTHLLVFGITAFVTGLAGGLHALQFQAVGPNIFSMSSLLFIIAVVVVGGPGTFWGPVLGTVLLMLADEAMREMGEFRTLGLGLAIAVVTVALPRGIIGHLPKFKRKK
jgi:branched-chain amino acid transport system permease protein